MLFLLLVVVVVVVVALLLLLLVPLIAVVAVDSTVSICLQCFCPLFSCCVHQVADLWLTLLG